MVAAALVNLAPEQVWPELQTLAVAAVVAVALGLAPAAQVDQASLLFLFQRLNTLALQPARLRSPPQAPIPS